MDLKPKDLQKTISDRQDIETDEDVNADAPPVPLNVPT
jgi:hypothetical protein